MSILNIDFFSTRKITGWTTANIDIYNKHSIYIVDSEGNRKKINDEICLVRKDVNSEFNLRDDCATGFDVNLFDLFNTRPLEYSIFIDDYEAWSFREELLKLENKKSIEFTNPINNSKKQVIILYKSKSWFEKEVGKLLNWNKNVFSKDFNGGIGYSLYSENDFDKLEKNLLKSDGNNIYLIQRDIATLAITACNEITKSPIIMIEKESNLNLDFSGVASSLFWINSFGKDISFSSTVLYRIIETLTTYSDLFFPEANEECLIYISGEISEAEQKVIRNLNSSTQCIPDCVITGRMKFSKLSDYNPELHSIFLKSNLLRNSYDLIKKDKKIFLEEILRRGLKIKFLKVD